MYSTLSSENQLLATKFYVPVAPGTLISRPRLSNLLDKRLKYPLTLVSAPAGFGKTTLLASWSQSLQASHCQVAWISLNEEDNDPRVFWMYVFTALQTQQPERFAPLLMQLQSSEARLSIKLLLTALINLLAEGTDRFVLILDDYHLITNSEIHTALAYLIEHLPVQLRLIVATRTDPPLPLPLLRTRQQALEVRTDQLRCTAEETKDFFHQVMGLQLPEKVIEEVTARTEGWLVGLQLLGLSLPEQADHLSLLEEIRGDQHYILDYLTEVVLQRQPQEVQTFLLCTSILEQLSASLCDAVMEGHGSQQMLKQLDQSNLFLVSLDSRQQWYRYHALFAEALRSQLEQSHADLVPILHARASHWYAQHHQTTPAILHAFRAKDWYWAAELIEQAYPPLLSFTWGMTKHTLVQCRHWVEQLPAEILACRPDLSLVCVHLLWTITPHALLYRWLDLAKAGFKARMSAEVSQVSLSPQVLQEQRDQLGKVLTGYAYFKSYEADGHTAFALYEQALAYLSPENAAFRAIVAIGKSIAYYLSSANDIEASIKWGYQAALFTQEAKQPIVRLNMIAITAIHLMAAGRLHEANQITQQALLPETSSGDPQLPWIGWITLCQAELLREWNELACAQPLATEAVSLCEQAVSHISLLFLYWGYAVLIRVSLSCGDLDAARTLLQQAEQIGKLMNQLVYQYVHSCFTTVDQVRLWLACGELGQATRWVEQLDIMELHLTPFARERQEVARARILLATDQPTAALQHLESVLQRATAGQRRGHVIEIRLLQALAQQMLHEEPQALATLWEAVRLGEPEGYLRCFVEEGEAMAVLLCKLQEKQRKGGPTPYLDRVLAAFPNPSQTLANQPKRMAKQTPDQPLLEPLSERELQVLQLMEKGASNQDIARELVIAIDTVKRHVSHILAKLDAQNRVQAVKQAYKLGLLERED